jgi:diaminopimelate epimerase
MNGRVAVTKMHGARNDFIVLDARDVRVADLSAFAQNVCDRRTGIGADGLLVIERSERAAVAMRVINADGSEAEMCGNGIRCVARYLDERGEGGELDIETVAGIIHTEVIDRGDEYRVRVRIGTPRVGVGADDELPVDVGNPHVVLFSGDVDRVDLLTLGREHPDVNVHAVQVLNVHELRVRHHERGVGITMACGTGAVASAAAAIVRGAARSPVIVHVPGGDLTIEWDGHGDAFMTGPARQVFETTI